MGVSPPCQAVLRIRKARRPLPVALPYAFWVQAFSSRDFSLALGGRMMYRRFSLRQYQEALAGFVVELRIRVH